MWQYIIDFLSLPIFSIIGAITIIINILGLLYIIYLYSKGLFPVLYRLGIGLSKRKIAIFADNEYEALKNILVDSKVFKESNVSKIEKSEVKKVRKLSLILVHYASQKDILDKIISEKEDRSALIVYAPFGEGKIDEDVMDTINSTRNSIVVNFKGRLLNDVLVSMMTTGYVMKHD